jgi:glycosyltransferase involved in cell wall biosynthesis
MHPGFFSAIDSLAELTKIRPVSVWGRPSEEAYRAFAFMRHPEAVRLHGYTHDPYSALVGAGIFFYPLCRSHYGTGENALIEAMSLGLVPVVLDNPVETSIVQDGETGLVAFSLEAAVRWIARLVNEPQFRLRLSRNAAAFAKTRSPYMSARQFADLWRSMVTKERAVA